MTLSFLRGTSCWIGKGSCKLEGSGSCQGNRWIGTTTCMFLIRDEVCSVLMFFIVLFRMLLPMTSHPRWLSWLVHKGITPKLCTVVSLSWDTSRTEMVRAY
jgi:hypothetical protein